ncbi:MAG: class I SAM-dependent methyltransferase [Planctomycetota bacterium]
MTATNPRPERAFERAPGWAVDYRDRRFRSGSGAATDRRERRALRSLLARCEPAEGPWLDVPCGAGRMSGLLPGPVTQVDYAREMLGAIEGADGPRIRASAFELPFADDAFSGVLCHRLLHHVPGRAERVAILGELARVSRGAVIVSFFHAASLQNLRRGLARRLLRKRRSSRGGVSWRTFQRDLGEAGLKVVAVRALLPFVSEQWLVLARRH